jgi:acetyltransferase-like isoleucine patch superfamily enzyme
MKFLQCILLHIKEQLKILRRCYIAKTKFPFIKIEFNTAIGDDVSIGNDVRVLSHCRLSNVKINSFTYIGGSCHISQATIGSFCSIAENVIIGLGKHPTSVFVSTYPGFYSNASGATHFFQQNFQEHDPVIIGNDVWIGTRACILDGVKIGDGAIIGANAVVTKNVEPYSIVAGNPARVIRKRFSDDDIRFLLDLEWWNWSTDTVRAMAPFFSDINLLKQHLASTNVLSSKSDQL